MHCWHADICPTEKSEPEEEETRVRLSSVPLHHDAASRSCHQPTFASCYRQSSLP